MPHFDESDSNLFVKNMGYRLIYFFFEKWIRGTSYLKMCITIIISNLIDWNILISLRISDIRDFELSSMVENMNRYRYFIFFWKIWAP